MTSTLTHYGIPVLLDESLRLDPTPGEEAVRIVRHGYAAVLAWLEDTSNSLGPVGARPSDPDHRLYLTSDGSGLTYLMHPATWEHLRVTGAAPDATCRRCGCEGRDHMASSLLGSPCSACNTCLDGWL